MDELSWADTAIGQHMTYVLTWTVAVEISRIARDKGVFLRWVWIGFIGLMWRFRKGWCIGLRRGEALGLRWSDVDLNAGRINIAQALYRVSKELRFDDVKSETSAASVPLPPELVTILRQHRRQQLANPAEAGANEHGLVFTTSKGTPLEPRNVNRAFAALCRRANVRPIRLHDLRRSCATLLFSMGVDAATVQRILRHSSITVTTGTYLEVIERVQRDAVAGMDNLFNSGSDDNDSASS